ncbi:esterase 6 [Culex quinquefasciatus]|uniref:Carboxylic ester hydrolase n=1 Tax=Culex quinquefasciatus TaxID=7176 RepID=B0XAN3_CULQU|nr:esterase 6 [Culex quinquefasciatus]|eukprot:XP_001866705.1 esterase 6 [Culex quinquefasciatus]
MDGRHKLSASGATSMREVRRVLAEIGPGKLLGVVERLPSGAEYFVFKGIPYAKAPVGELRFQPPQLLPQLPFSPLDCAQDAPGCFTVDNYLPNDQMSEDCLHLNVFTPSLPSKPPSETPQLPVMVWFHGGGFVTGSAQSSMYGANHLVQEGVVIVTVNYRLGPLGFLCLPDVGIHGNMGLKDQRMSLAWVRENIKGFGGNPDNVTIFGQSAGGSSVHLHYLSENSRPLFHKAIAQSGTAFNQWVLQKDPDGRARRLAKLLGCKDENNDELVYELIKKKLPKSIPIMMGIMSEEGVALASHVLSSLDLYKQTLETQLLPFALDVADEKISKDAFSSIKKFFFKEQALSIETVPNLVQVLGDNANKFAGYLSAELHNLHQSSPLYFYIFSYMSELNKLRELSQAPASCPGAAHGDDLCYLFS